MHATSYCSRPNAPASHTAARDIETRIASAVDAVRSEVCTRRSEPVSTSAATARAYTVAVQLERAFKTSQTRTTIHLCTGPITPTSDVEQFAEEAPIVSSGQLDTPAWATTTTEHTWVEIQLHSPGTPARYIVDGFAPPQVTGTPTLEPQIAQQDSPTERPEAYPDAAATVPLDDFAEHHTPESLWTDGTKLYPTPPSPQQQSADGGDPPALARNTIHQLGAQDGLSRLATGAVDAIITSPPYRLQKSNPGTEAVFGGSPDCDHDWTAVTIRTDTPIRQEGSAGLNMNYDMERQQDERHRTVHLCDSCDAYRGQLGHEPTIGRFVGNLVTIFEEAKRVLADDGSLFVNIADSYDAGQSLVSGPLSDEELADSPGQKSLVGLPERFMLAMIDAGWYTREHYIWAKPNGTPDGRVTDRANTAHEHVFRFVTSPDRYHDTGDGPQSNVLSIPTAAGVDAPVAPMPNALVRRLMDTLAKTDADKTVLDPFAGTGTVAEVALERNLSYLGFELSPESFSIAQERLTESSSQARLHRFR